MQLTYRKSEGRRLSKAIVTPSSINSTVLSLTVLINILEHSKKFRTHKIIELKYRKSE